MDAWEIGSMNLAMRPILLSQSLVRAMDHGREPHQLAPGTPPQCPRRAKAVYLDGLTSEPSMAMLQGNFLETLLWGADGNGNVVQLPRKGGMQKREVQVRIEKNAWLLKNRWAPAMRMDFQAVHPQIVLGLGERYHFRARIDMYTSMLDGDTFHPKVICDLKLTADVNNTFGPFCWGAPERMDDTQPVAYSWAYRVANGESIPFYYLVLSHGRVDEHLCVRVQVDAAKERIFLSSLQRTVERIERYDTKGEWPLVPSSSNCRGCPLRTTCIGALQNDRRINIH